MKKSEVNSYLMNNIEEYFEHFKNKQPVFYNSNVFFRDIQFKILTFFEEKGLKLSYSVCEKMAEELIEKLEEENKFVKLTGNSWKVNFEINPQVEAETAPEESETAEQSN